MLLRSFSFTKEAQSPSIVMLMAAKIDIKKQRILVTGGSGTVGRNVIKELIKRGAKNIISISRDENLIKQAESEVGSSAVTFKLGDITDTQLISRLLQDTGIVIHTAAIKHVSLAEQNPREAHRINIVGLLNLLDNSATIKRFVHISSDKAIGVVNCYGATKLLGEYLVRESNGLYQDNKYFIIRCPNILGSRGSVLDVWKQSLAKSNKIKITDPDMTRYFILPREAAEFIVDITVANDLDQNETYYPVDLTHKFLLSDLADVFISLFGNKNSKIEVMGAMPGEKKHEDYIKDVELTPKGKLSKLVASI